MGQDWSGCNCLLTSAGGREKFTLTGGGAGRRVRENNPCKVTYIGCTFLGVGLGRILRRCWLDEGGLGDVGRRGHDLLTREQRTQGSPFSFLRREG
jgi:hypothetical protein